MAAFIAILIDLLNWYSFANVFFIQQKIHGSPPHRLQQNQKLTACKHWPGNKRFSLFQLPLFFICLRWEMLIKIHSYAKAASYHHHQSPFSGMSFQPFIWACSSVTSMGFGKHLGRRPVYYRYRGSRGFCFIGSSGWYLHCSPSGRRWLSALPFLEEGLLAEVNPPGMA